MIVIVNEKDILRLKVCVDKRLPMEDWTSVKQGSIILVVKYAYKLHCSTADGQMTECDGEETVRIRCP